MGFSLEAFFEEANEIMNNKKLSAEERQKQLEEHVKWGEKYARECGNLPKK